MTDDIIVGVVLTHDKVFERYLKSCMMTAALEAYIVRGNPNTSLAQAYNEIIKNTTERYIIIAHEDIVFGPEIVDVINNLGSGIYGGVGLTSEHKYKWACSVDPEKPQEVVVFDGCFMIYDRNFGVGFDEELFTSFHMVIDDYCYYMRSLGHKLYIPHIPGFGHQSGPRVYGGRNTRTYSEERKKLVRKWSDIFEVVTT